MRTFDLIFDGVTKQRMVIDHKFFLILTDQGFPIDIAVRKNSGFAEMKGLQAGFGFKLGEARGREFIFTCENAQTCKVFIGDDEAIYNRLSGTVTVNGGNIATLGGITSQVKTVYDGQTYTNSYKSITNMAANTPETVVAPSSNINGILISAAYINSYNGSISVNCAFVSKASAPNSIIDGDVILGSYSGNSNYAGGSLITPIKIPAGRGIYYINAVADVVSFKSMLFTIL